MIERRITDSKEKAPRSTERAVRKVLASGVFGTLKAPPKKPTPQPAPPSRPNLP